MLRVSTQLAADAEPALDEDAALDSLKWQFGSCSLETSPDKFGPFGELVSTWQQRRGDRALPSRGDFDLNDFRDWIGRIFIAKIERDPFDLRFVLWGTQLTDWWRVDYTNRTLGEKAIDPELWDMVELKYFGAMDRDPFIGIASGLLTQHRRSHVKVIGLDLPMSDGDGLTHVVSAHMRIDLKDSVQDILPDCPIEAFR